MDSRPLYTKLTSNIEKVISNFKADKISSATLNDQLMINVSSMCRFLKKREEEKKNLPENKDKVNETILDVFVPFSRLSQTLQRKIEEMNSNTVIEESKEFEKDLDLSADFGIVSEYGDKEKNFNNLMDDDINSTMNDNDKYLLDDGQSVCMSLFNHRIEGTGEDFNNYKQNSSKPLSKLSTQGPSQVFYDSESRASQMSFRSSMIEEDKKKEIEEAKEEFKDKIKNVKVIQSTVNDMSIEYLRYMYDIFSKMKGSQTDKGNEENSSLSFINQFKSFVLEIGISDKKFYEQCIREIIYNKNMFEFSEFLECFRKLLNLKFDQTFLKYKFLFHITKRKNEEYFDDEDLRRFYDLIKKSKKIYDQEIYQEIVQKLVLKYKKIFPNEAQEKRYDTRKLSLVLEQFFDLK